MLYFHAGREPWEQDVRMTYRKPRLVPDLPVTAYPILTVLRPTDPRSHSKLNDLHPTSARLLLRTNILPQPISLRLAQVLTGLIYQPSYLRRTEQPTLTVLLSDRTYLGIARDVTSRAQYALH